MTFFDRVKELVKLKNTTIKAFVESHGINYGSYNTLRKTNNLPRADEATKIATALGVSVEYLVTGKESDNSSVINDAKQKLTETIQLLDKL